MCCTSPYEGLKQGKEIIDENRFLEVTNKLIKDYPLNEEQMISLCTKAWNIIKEMNIKILEKEYKLVDLHLHGSTYGGLIDIALRELIVQSDESKWDRPVSKADKDVINKQDKKFSLEIKSGGQSNTHVFGNRSSNLEGKNEQKSMAGYYITLNYYNDAMYLIRFGWLDKEDWKEQVEGGQQAKIEESAYKFNLNILYGRYLMDTPTDLLLGYNLSKDYENLTEDDKILISLKNIGNLIKYHGDNDSILKLKNTLIFSAKVNLEGKTVIDLSKFLTCDDSEIEKVEIKELILKEALNIKINQIKGFNSRILGDITLSNLILNGSFNDQNPKVQNIIKKIKTLCTIEIKKVSRPSTYTSNSLDVDLYRNYKGEDEMLNKAREFFS